MAVLENGHVWNMHKNFQIDRPSLHLRQSPHQLSNLLHGEVIETREAFDEYSGVIQHNGDLHKLLFELADVYIYAMSLAQQLGREDLAPEMLSHLHRENSVIPAGSSLQERMSLLEDQSLSLRGYVEETPDHDMGAHDEVFTNSLIGIAAIAGSMAHDIEPDPRITFAHIVEAKIRYNNHRYESGFFAYDEESGTRFRYGSRLADTYEVGRLKGKHKQRTSPQKEMHFLNEVLREANITSLTASGPTYQPKSHLVQ